MRVTQVSSSTAHLIGPGKTRVVNGQITYGQDSATGIRIRPEGLRYVFCYGDVTITGEALALLFAHRVEVAWLTPGGFRCLGRLATVDSSSCRLRLGQYRAALDNHWCCQQARRLIIGKIEAIIQTVRHYQRHKANGAGELMRHLERLRSQVEKCEHLDSVRGLEGVATAAWYRFLGKMLEPPWEFTTRQKRPPKDPVNALLSLGYTWLLRQAEARLHAVGLEITLGTLHQYQPGRPSLACDLVEPHRPGAVDRWVLRNCNQKRVTPDDFQKTGDAITIKQERFGWLVQDWQRWWIEGGHEKNLLKTIQDYLRELERLSPTLSASPA